MNYIRSVRYVFDQPNWLTNVLFGVVCQFIPIVGPIVWLGYQFDVVEGLQQSRDQRAPDFSFNRFMPYLTRGLWPFLVQLIVMLPVMILTWFVMFGVGSLIGGSVGEGLSPAIALLVLVLAFGLLLTVAFLVGLLILPMCLRAGLAQELALGQAWTFMKAFHERVLRELIWSQLFMLVASSVLMSAGLLLCCIGIYPAIVIVYLTHAHQMYQLYALYLERGGPPVPLKVENALAGPGRF